jgi:hypothetical protein
MPQKRRPKSMPERRIRVRSKSLAEIDQAKVSLAFWLMAKRQLEEEKCSAEGTKR